ncbi:NACHT and WD repeat domain-containing protein [Streptomyces sp. NPDC057554]|uniref:NACHT and WD repeat domain-containing protein n=1 Tax=Streptomyces sp. NPDC057554 TaxID=3350538 RepID=UPI0036973613
MTNTEDDRMPEASDEAGGFQGVAMSLAVHDFAGCYRTLPFRQEALALREALTASGYAVESHDGLTAEALGAKARAFLKAPGTVPRLLHVLSHGVCPLPAGRLHVVGSCGQFDEATDVQAWLDLVDLYHRDRPYTLLVLDLCNAGQAAWPDWTQNAVGFERRAWVIGACDELDNAYNARLTQALAGFLTHLGTDPASLGLDTVSPHLPFATLVEEARARVDELASAPGAHGQRVTATPYDGAYPDLPFFRNPLAVSTAVQLDEILDFGHWQRASTGKMTARPHRPGVGFVGRSAQLGRIARWLDSTVDGDADLARLCLVTGRRGSGKSALLGVLVCATHDDFDKVDDRVWLTAFGGNAPSRHGPGHMAAVHARRRGLGAILGSVTRQLRVGDRVREWSHETSPARALCEAIRELPYPPVLVMDAVDEAEVPSEVMGELIQPLSERRPDGTPLAYCLVGIRDEGTAHPLCATARESGLFIDLEEVDPHTLREDLHTYVSMLVRTEPAYADVRFSAARPRLAEGMAVSLTGRPVESRGGEFLISGLYTHHLLSRTWPAFDAGSAEALGRAVPLDLAGVLELDLKSGAAGQPLRLPLLTALAHTHGAGMPASVALSVAWLFLPGGVPPDPYEAQEILDGESHYLRVSVDTDGTPLYRLYNQALDDHLRTARGGTGDGSPRSAILEAVLAADTVRSTPGRTAWSTPYVRRHAAQHAADEGRLLELLATPGFLIHADVEVLGPLLARLLPRPTEPHALLLRTPAARLRGLPFGTRRQLFALEAMRWGTPALSHELVSAAAHGAAPARTVPLWSTGTNLDARQLNVFADHTDAVDAVVVLDLDGRPVTVSAGADGTIRIADLGDGSPVGEPLTGLAAQITSLTAATLEGHDRPVLITGSANGPVHVWDLTTGKQLGGPLLGHTGRVMAMTTWGAPGEVFLVTGSADATVRLWRLPGGEPVGEPLVGHTDEVTALSTWGASGETFLVTGSADATVRLWRLPVRHDPDGRALDSQAPDGQVLDGQVLDGQVLDGQVPDGQVPDGLVPVGEPRAGHTSAVTAVTVLPSDTGGTVLSGDATGRIRQWPVRWPAGGSPAEGTVLRGHTGAVTALCTSGGPGARVLVSAGDDGTVRSWDLTGEPSLPAPAPGHDGAIRGLGRLTSGGRDIAVSAGADSTVRFWRADGGGPAEDLPPIALPAGPAALDCSPEARLLVTGTTTGAVLLHSADDGTLLAREVGHRSGVTAVTCLMIGGTPCAVVAHQDGLAQVWDLREKKPVGTLSGHRAAIASVSFFGSAPVPAVVTAGYDRTVRLWDMATCSEYGQLTGHPEAVTAVACTVLGTVPTAVTACADGSVRLYELENHGQSGELAGHTEFVTSVACAGVDGVPTAVTTCRDGTVRLWNLTSGRQAEELLFPDPVHRALWLPGDRLLVGYGMDVAVFQASGLHDTDTDADED